MKSIVLTGGPCGGKTTVMRALAQRFDSERSVVLVPEVATWLLESRHYRLAEQAERIRFQTDILSVQQEWEERAARQGAVVVVDRGMLDGSVYWPGGYEAWLQAFGLNLGECLARYDAVFHFRTQAAREGYERSAVRLEAPEEARTLDAALEAVWSRHHRWTRLEASAPVDAKTDAVAAEIDRLQGLAVVEPLTVVDGMNTVAAAASRT